MVPYRSILFVPGHKPAWIDKALAAGADCIVPRPRGLGPRRPQGRRPADRRRRPSPPSARRTRRVGLFVRVNPLDTRLTGGDLEAVVVPGLTGVFAPKISVATDVLRYDALLDHFEERNGVSGLEYIVPVEMIGAIQNAREIAQASPRVGRDDRPHRRARRHRPRRRLPVDAGGRGDPLPAQPHPAGLPGGGDPPADRAVGAAGGPRRAQGLRGEGPAARLPRDDRHPPLARRHRQRGVHADGRRDRVPRGPGRRLRRRPRPPATAPSATGGVHIDKAHADTATEWLAHARATPGGQPVDDRPAPADRLGIDAPEGGH